MAFKSLSKYQEDKNGEFFVLPNDGDHADVIFLYRSIDDVLVADVHYISSSEYKGYAHCCEKGCPACNYGERGIRLDHKIFIPLYNVEKNKIEFWDRSTFFEQTLQKYVFGPFPNPSETIFRITRHGEANSRDTKYEITPVYRNTSMPYDKILSDFGITLPAGYSAVCREMSIAEMSACLNGTGSGSNLPDYGYTPVPRGSASPEDFQSGPVVETPQYSAPPEVAPPVADLPEAELPVAGLPAHDIASEVPFDEGDSPAAPVESSEQTDDSNDTLDNVSF